MPGLKVRWRRGVAYAVGSVAGQRVRRSLGTRDGGRAEELRAHLEARLWKRHTYGEAAVRTFEEAAIAYMKAGGEGAFLGPLIVRFRGRALGSILPEEIRTAAREIYPGRKPATWNRQGIVPGRAVVNHGAALGWCPAIAVRNFPVEKVRRQAATRDWIDAFLARADADGLPHLAAAVLFMFQTGARVSEAARVLPAHVDLGRRIVLLERTKTSTWEACHITAELVVRLANLTWAEDAPIFGYAGRDSIYQRMKAVCRRAGLPWRSPHQAGRHGFATHALASGATIRQTMEAGRWKSARMVLEIYADAEGAGREIAELFDTKRTQPHPPQAKKRGGSKARSKP